MVQEQQLHSTPIEGSDITSLLRLLEEASESDESADTDTSLDDAAVNERDYVRSRLKEELGHEPTEAEVDEWLRQHTEGY